MKNKITGWKNVFSFTLIQTAKSKSFKSATVTLALIFFLALFGVNVYSGLSSKEDETVVATEENEQDIQEAQKEVEKKAFAKIIYVNDETGFDISVNEMQKYCNKKYDDLKFTRPDKDHEAMVAEMKQSNEDCAYVDLKADDSGLKVSVYLPKNSKYKEKQAESFANRITKYMEKWKDEILSLNKEQSEFLSADINVSVVTPNKKSLEQMLVEMYVPMMFCLALYMCIILYGQMVGNSVATEKSSKVMELLLTSIRPLAIIVGKVLSMMALSLIQLAIFIAVGLAGNGIGTMVAQRFNPDYSNIVVEVLTRFDLMSVFSPLRIITALVVFILGFTFYCSFAGLMGATVNRGEDLSSAMTVYSTVSVLGFAIAYIPNVLGSVGTGFQTFAAIFPLSSPFILPAKILTGEISNTTVAIAFVVLIITVVLFMLVVAKVYEMVILYTGNKIGLKQIRHMMKVSKTEA